jgi:hypothetical protein
MSPSDIKRWAKEEIVDAIDAMIADKIEFGLHGDTTIEERLELERQRQRVATHLGMLDYKRKK